MKKSILCTLLFLEFLGAHAQNEELNKVTFAIGAGYAYNLNDLYQPSLTTDTNKFLKLQKLSRSSFVISSIIVFKLSKLKVESGSKKLLRVTKDDKTEPVKFKDRFSINLALNLLEVNSGDISFNKSIDGGLGIGCFITPSIQVAVFYDLVRYRQLRDYVINDYKDKRIPNGDSFFNALDEKNDDLFYTKTFSGVSLKAIFSLGNKKSD